MKNFVKKNHVKTMIAPIGGVKSGELVVVGGDAVVATFDANHNEEFEGLKGAEVVLPKLSTDTPASGDIAYWDDVEKYVSTTSEAGRYKIGTFAETLGTGTTEVRVTLDGVAVEAIGASQPATGNTVAHTFTVDAESEVKNDVFYLYHSEGRAVIRGIAAATKKEEDEVEESDKAYWDATSKHFTKTSSPTRYLVGVFAKDAADDTTDCYVNLFGGFVAVVGN